MGIAPGCVLFGGRMNVPGSVADLWKILAWELDHISTVGTTTLIAVDNTPVSINIVGTLGISFLAPAKPPVLYATNRVSRGTTSHFRHRSVRV